MVTKNDNANENEQMTYDEITLWRRWMQGKGMLNNFEYLYNSHRFDKRELDEFLEDVAAEDVILSAFDFSGAGNTIFSFKYWKDLDSKWQLRLREFRDNGDMIEAQTVVCINCKRRLPRSAFAMTNKGLLHKHCKECESGEWARQKREAEKQKKDKERLEKEIAQKQAELERIKAEQEAAQETAPTPGIDAAPKPAEPAVKPTVAVPVKPDRLAAPRLGEYDATLHYKKGQKSITFNSVLSQQIRDGEYTKCYLNPDRQMRQFLIFNRVEGANITGASTMAQSLLNVNSAEIVRALAARFGLDEGDNYYLHITKNLSKVNEFMTVEVLLVRTREEYARLAEKREEARKKGKPIPGDDVPEYEDDSEVEERHEEPTVSRHEEPAADSPLIDFGLGFGDGHSAPPPAGDILQMIVDRHLATERDSAAFLFQKGWELHEPVVVTRHKKFSL